MDQLLTVREVQDALKIDRVTVYRMLKDGRLTGTRVGRQWRFARAAIAALTATRASAPAADVEVLPAHCVQLVQDVFAEIAEVGALTVDPAGQPITAPSGECAFCALIQASPAGRAACSGAWYAAARSGPSTAFATCHAGLQAWAAPVMVAGEHVATLIACRFYTAPPQPAEELQRVTEVASACGIPRHALDEAAQSVPVLDARRRALLGYWVEHTAAALAGMGQERAQLVGRLRAIAALSGGPLDTQDRPPARPERKSL